MRHIWLLTVVGATLSALAGTASEAQAASIKECGRVGGPGYAVFNITTRVTSCRTARGMAKSYYRGRWTNVPRNPGRKFRRGAYTCSWQRWGPEGSDMRCTASGGRVVRWQASA